jgi:hypothetical protein
VLSGRRSPSCRVNRPELKQWQVDPSREVGSAKVRAWLAFGRTVIFLAVVMFAFTGFDKTFTGQL